MNTTEKARLAAEIRAFRNTDFSDSPELSGEQLALMKPSHYRNMAHYKPIKKTVNVRLDADVVDWLQSGGKGYQTRMNAILREAMKSAAS
ncbi:MAG: BrnA antitoxin family protein [Spirochaetales bacterium]|nr:BrnA antitoxin family protein [Spirochaetales bacterium]